MGKWRGSVRYEGRVTESIVCDEEVFVMDMKLERDAAELTVAALQT